VVGVRLNGASTANKDFVLLAKEFDFSVWVLITENLDRIGLLDGFQNLFLNDWVSLRGPNLAIEGTLYSALNPCVIVALQAKNISARNNHWLSVICIVQKGAILTGSEAGLVHTI
jgi:hypothetical protein